MFEQQDEIKFFFDNDKGILVLDTMFNITNPELLKAPLYQQAFDWFREKYNLDSWIEPINYGAPHSTKIGYDILIIGQRRFSFLKTYEEARLECLKKLIQIVKDYENGN